MTRTGVMGDDLAINRLGAQPVVIFTFPGLEVERRGVEVEG